MNDGTNGLQSAADFLRRARTGDRTADLPAALIPATADDSYRIQHLVIGDEEIAGWKILATAAPDAFSCAALARSSLIGNGGRIDLGDRAPEIEVEIAVRLRQDLPPRPAPFGRDDILAALDTAHAAIEIVESRFADRKRAHPLSALADAQSSRAFVIGTGTRDWQELDLPGLDIVLTLDGSELARKQGGASVAQIVEALVWLANHAAARGTGLRAGQSIITGARIGPLPIPLGASLAAEVASLGRVELSLAP
jgi:2-keto-4-pentenoate hydratase